MKIYNTLTRKKEEFISLKAKKITIYICGPTTYNYIHIGNSRPIIFFDSLRKYFIHLGYKVIFIQNYTDIDDKIIEKSLKEKIDPLLLSNKYINEYEKDAKFLKILKPTYSPKVSENIKEIISFIKLLIKKKFAYEIKGNIYFEVRKYKNYGKLSGRNIDELKSGIRLNNIEKDKKDSLDFVLWKKAKKNEIFWESPWGKGRPGWHIECSVMSIKYTNWKTLDIHGGGLDLIFPHHENEIAQSESILKKPFVNYWIHNGIITINKEKMSKSLKNDLLIRDISKKYSGEIIRYFILSNNHKNPIDFNFKYLQNIEKALIRLNNMFEKLKFLLKKNINFESKNLYFFLIKIEEKIKKALQDDFNTAIVISCFFELVKELNKAIKQKNINKKSIEKSYFLFKEYLDKILGILPYHKKEIITNEYKENYLNLNLIEFLIELRKKAKDKKNFEEADFIRDKLKKLKIELIDTKNGVKWKKII